MKITTFILIIILGATWFVNPFTYIARVNRLQKEAEQNYRKGEIPEATAKYLYLLQDLGIESEAIHINLAHTYFSLGQEKDATFFYKKVFSQSKNQIIKSIALTQLGVLKNHSQPEATEEALSIFKEAILLWQENETARYNYELLKKRLQEETPQDTTQQEQDPENQTEEENQQDQYDMKKDENGQEMDIKEEGEGEKDVIDKKKADEEGEEEMNQASGGDEPKENIDEEKLDEMNLNIEKANMILDAMKNQEIQYLQQTTRKLQKEQKEREKERIKDSKPDW